VWIPKCRRQALYDELRVELGKVLRRLAEQKGCNILEGHLLRDHIHMLVEVPPKIAVSDAVGFMKGKSAIYISRNFVAQNRRTGLSQSFWARGFYVSTVGREEEVIRQYIRNQQEEDERVERLRRWG